MSYSASANRYREAEVMSATPGQLVVMTYDHLLVSLRRARVAIEQEKLELRVDALDRARRAISELLVAVDHEKGGKIAADLGALYAFLFGELVDLGRTPELRRLDRVIAIVADLREAFASIVTTSAGNAA